MFNHHQLFHIETHFLKVHMNCDGCQQKVKKLLNKVEGVVCVKINKEEQIVVVSGCVDSETLIKKLVKSGKHAEVWKNDQEQGGDINADEIQFNLDNAFADDNYLFPTSLEEDEEIQGNQLNQQLGYGNIAGMPLPNTRNIYQHSQIPYVLMNNKPIMDLQQHRWDI